MKKQSFFGYCLFVMTLILSFEIIGLFYGISNVSAELCNKDLPTMCLELLNSHNESIDEKLTSPLNTNKATLTMESSYGKAVLGQLKFHNTGSSGVIGYCQDFTRSILLTYNSLDYADFDSTITDSSWFVYGYNNLTIVPEETKTIDIVFVPVPGMVVADNDQHMNYNFKPYPYNSVNSEISSMGFNVIVDEKVTGSLGKQYSVTKAEDKDSCGAALITITPESDAINNLKDNEYLLVYFKIDQTDGNPYKEVVVLQKDEKHSTSIINSGNADRYGDSAKFSHQVFDNGNMLLRSRDTNNEKNTEYWLLFKSAEPIILRCYKRVITGSPENTYGAAKADLDFIYADVTPDADGVFEPKEQLVSVDTGGPGKPDIISPENNKIFTTKDSIDLSWECKDCGDDLKYKVFYGTSENSVNIPLDGNKTEFYSQTNESFPSDKLKDGTTSYYTTYYWQVHVKDRCGKENVSEISSFTVKFPAPDKPNLSTCQFEDLKLETVDPIIGNPVGRPIALDYWDSKNKKLALKYSYPAYSQNVDIYLAVQYNDKLKFISKDSKGNIVYSVYSVYSKDEHPKPPEPFLKDCGSSENGSIVLDYAGVLGSIDLPENFVFYSGVFPTSNDDIFDSNLGYYIFSFELPVSK